MIASEVTDLPQPDSPTSPTVDPAATSKLTPSTAVNGSVPRRRELDLQVLDRQQRRAHRRFTSCSGGRWLPAWTRRAG